MNDRKLQMHRLKSITRKSNANANANVDKSFQLRPMRDTNFWSFNPEFFPVKEPAKRVKFAYEILPENCKICPTLDNESPTARISSGAEKSNLKIRDSSVQGGGPLRAASAHLNDLETAL